MSEKTDAGTAAPAARDASAIDAQELSYAYPDGTRALRGVSFRIQTGESVAIVGPNGAGKSTLALIAVGVLMPASGNLWVFGMRIAPRNIEQIRNRVGLIFQNPDDQLFLPTVFEDVAFGPLNMGLGETEALRRAEEALKIVGLEAQKGKFPGHLSAGQKRAATIAGVLAMKPDLLILDEPSSGLDPRGRRALIRQLSSLEQTKILISHDLEMILDLCPRIIVLDQGMVVADGVPAEVLADAAFAEAHGLEVPYSLRRDHKHRFLLSGSPHEGEHGRG